MDWGFFGTGQQQSQHFLFLLSSYILMDGSHKKNTTGLCLLDRSTALQFLKSYRDVEVTAAATPGKV